MAKGVHHRATYEIIKTLEEARASVQRRAPPQKEFANGLTSLIAGLEPMMEDGDEASFIAAALLDGEKAPM